MASASPGNSPCIGGRRRSDPVSGVSPSRGHPQSGRSLSSGQERSPALGQESARSPTLGQESGRFPSIGQDLGVSPVLLHQRPETPTFTQYDLTRESPEGASTVMSPHIETTVTGTGVSPPNHTAIPGMSPHFQTVGVSPVTSQPWRPVHVTRAMSLTTQTVVEDSMDIAADTPLPITPSELCACGKDQGAVLLGGRCGACVQSRLQNGDLGATSLLWGERVAPLSPILGHTQYRAKSDSMTPSPSPRLSPTPSPRLLDLPGPLPKSTSFQDAQLASLAQLLDVVHSLARAHEGYARVEEEQLQNSLKADMTFDDILDAHAGHGVTSVQALANGDYFGLERLVRGVSVDRGDEATY